MRITALRRLLALMLRPTFDVPLFAAPPRASRWALVLRTWDALAAGASRRDIAEALFGLDRVPQWRLVHDSHFQRVRRLVAAARRASPGDYRAWADRRGRISFRQAWSAFAFAAVSG